MQQIQLPPLAEGEVYLGGFVNASGDAEHVILLAAQPDKSLTWPQAMEWAKSVGGDLPNRAETALAFRTCRDQFESRWYWTNEPEDSGWAWCQSFISGRQYSSQQRNEFRARAVRRLSI